jgi:aminomethyltransferase
MSNLRTPLYDWHLAQQARMVAFGGWDMPVQYTSIKTEHLAVRHGAGLFDISHMARLTFDGPDARALIQRVWTNDAAALAPGQVRYGLICNEQGGILDDVLVYNLTHSPWATWLMVVNASNRAKILDHLAAVRDTLSVTITDRTHEWGMVAVQGPESQAGRFGLKYYEATTTDLPAVGQAIVSRTGYTGEDGYEAIMPAEKLVGFCDRLIEEGVRPCGLGARDTLRLEAAMPLYGHELNETIDPFQAGLGWAVKLHKPEFIGRAALEQLAHDAMRPRRVGLQLDGRRIAREHSPLIADGHVIGDVTSGTLSPSLDVSIAMGYVQPQYTPVGTRLLVDIRGQTEPAQVVPLPFYRRPKQ